MPKIDVDIYALTVAELREFAKEHNINLHGRDKKADILEAIEEHLTSQETADDTETKPDTDETQGNEEGANPETAGVNLGEGQGLEQTGYESASGDQPNESGDDTDAGNEPAGAPTGQEPNEPQHGDQGDAGTTYPAGTDGDSESGESANPGSDPQGSGETNSGDPAQEGTDTGGNDPVDGGTPSPVTQSGGVDAVTDPEPPHILTPPTVDPIEDIGQLCEALEALGAKVIVEEPLIHNITIRLENDGETRQISGTIGGDAEASVFTKFFIKACEELKLVI